MNTSIRNKENNKYPLSNRKDLKTRLLASQDITLNIKFFELYHGTTDIIIHTGTKHKIHTIK